MKEDSVSQADSYDERFKLRARFKKKRDKSLKRDGRFDKAFDQDVKIKSGPKIDPFGRPLDNSSLNEIYSSSEDENENIQSEAPESQDKETIEYGDESDRIAVVGCDWDNITADDLFVLFETVYRSINNNNFLKAVKRAAIYLSDIGEKKISEENVSGPSIDGICGTLDEDGIHYPFKLMNSVNTISEEEEVRQEALRNYQRERSRYYYGVVELDSVEKARILYDELDGTEVSFSIDSLDLRFVPPSVEFSRDPKTECIKIPDNYQPPVSMQSALRHSKVECKWDTTPAKRFKTLTKRFTEQELASLDLTEYLASDDSEDSVPEESITNYKRLLKETKEVEEESSEEEESEHEERGRSSTVGNFKISFGPNVSMGEEEPVNGSSDYKESRKKKKEKVKTKKAKKEDTPEEDRHFDMKYLKNKKGQKEVCQVGFQSNLNDERLTKIFKDPKFSIDTTDPNYKETEFNQKLLQMKSNLRN